ncbi:oligosaccharide flippase family protein [Actinomycetospora sp. TBRC 11914]|uniref:oligosaccharide flippase family protein n=1 Tax=Actinomycetospora sp. TBRC 11914 TaxID=2729387 RepID=UPI00145CBCCE|nr:oligosaccharide flippase family protein [Actinomycetospora sp. TBRC 11914]NMO90668.1 oligosaccharide flippase family protein [Actinomycetospora sp. TBRC 11914]
MVPTTTARVPSLARLRAERGAGGGSLVLLAALATTAAMNYGLGLALAWLLPTEQFGAVGVLLNLLLLATSVLAAGFPWALAREVARRTDPADTAGVLRAALRGNLALGLVLGGGFAGVQLTTGAILPGVGPLPTLLAAATIVVLAVVAVLLGALQGARRFDGVGAARVGEIVTKVVLALVVVGLFGSLVDGVVGVSAALLVAACVSALVALLALADRLPRRADRVRTTAGAGFAAAVPMAVSTTGFGLMGTLDVLALGALGRGAGVTLAVVGVYQAGAVLARAPFFVGSALSDAAFPFIAGAPTLAAAHARLLAALRWVPLVLVPVQLVLVVAPGPVLDVVLPGAYAGAATVVRVLSLGTTGLLLADMLLKALFARGMAAAVAARVPVAVAAQVAALVVGVPRVGALGAAWAFAVGTWAAVALLGALYVARFRPPRPALAPALRWTGAVAVLVAALAVAASLPTPAALAVVVGALAAYALLLFCLGLVPAEVTALLRRPEVTR